MRDDEIEVRRHRVRVCRRERRRRDSLALPRVEASIGGAILMPCDGEVKTDDCVECRSCIDVSIGRRRYRPSHCRPCGIRPCGSGFGYRGRSRYRDQYACERDCPCDRFRCLARASGHDVVLSSLLARQLSHPDDAATYGAAPYAHYRALRRRTELDKYLCRPVSYGIAG